MMTQTQTKNGNGHTAQQEVSTLGKPQWLALPFEQQLQTFEPQIAAALPSHIKPERFRRVVVTAINQNPDLLQADRRSLFNSCVRAANDGLLPDGREGALVIFNTKAPQKDDNGRDQWIKKVQWMPMIQGILKRARNTGELASVSANIVYEKDGFRYTLGDSEEIAHEPFIGPDRGQPVGAYAIAKLKDGMVQREFMSVAEINKVRAVSKSKDRGPWVDWWTEMARKTVARRMFKWLPTSSDLSTLFDRDDSMAGEADATPQIIPPRPTREQFAAPAAEIEAEPEPAAAEAEPDDFTLTNSLGEILAETQDANLFATGFRTEMSKCVTPEALEAVWEGNSPQLHRLEDASADALRDDHEQFAKNLALAAQQRGKARKPADALV